MYNHPITTQIRYKTYKISWNMYDMNHIYALKDESHIYEMMDYNWYNINQKLSIAKVV